MDKYLDFWNLMAYDYAGSWDKNAGHTSNLHASASNNISTPFNTDQAIDYYTSHGVPSNKIVLGMPLYGRGFANTEGPGTPYQGLPQGTWEAGIWDYKQLPPPGSEIRTDEEVAGSWSFDPATKMMVSYDTPEIADRKARYIKDRGLGGGMWWEISGDKEGSDSLIQRVS
jgi:chitinase